MATFTPRPQPIKPCEVEHDEDGPCGELARIEVNGFPMCAHHFALFEKSDFVEAVGLIEPEAPQPAPTSTGPQVTGIGDEALLEEERLRWDNSTAQTGVCPDCGYGPVIALPPPPVPTKHCPLCEEPCPTACDSDECPMALSAG